MRLPWPFRVYSSVSVKFTIQRKITMSTLSIVILLAVAGVIAGAIFSPKFRQLLRIRGGKAVDAGTTALEKEQDQYKQLVAKIPAQRDSVARTKAGAVIAQKKLGTLTEKLAGIEAEYKQADAVKAPLGHTVTIEEVGALTAFLCTSGSSGMTGQTIYVDAGAHIVA